MNQGKYPEFVKLAARAAGMDAALSRRGFLLLSACALSGITALGLSEALGADPSLVILDNAKGMVLADPSRCVGCQRCELACTEFNDGRAQPSLARVKIERAMNFGPEGPTGGAAMQGTWGNGLVMQGVCRQCPHPVPCEMACPQEAIQADPQTGARVVLADNCIGCRMCQRACPWGMIVFDEQRHKASKCFLCHGKPKCVEACPSGALRFVPWRDITREGRASGATLPALSADKAKTCVECHPTSPK
ncbi:MAG: 4Fe-4S dicluster domain-containing protein [Desulfarculus sp.]|nr:4Fe-4S dicluster domain-containing protein [Desulfarculus sp.]